MKQFIHLVKHDFRLINRNNIIAISIFVSALYIGLFLALKSLGNVERFLVLVIFNDPVLLGFLFVGIMMLFERNENTLEALSVSPMRIRNYVLSKTMALTLVALLCCIAMVISGYGTNFNWIHFIMGTILTTIMFSFIGFVVVAGQKSFNHYMLRAIGVIILLGVPFLGFFELTSKIWFLLFPTTPAIELIALSFAKDPSLQSIWVAYLPTLLWCLIFYKWAIVKIEKHLKL